MNEAHNKKQVSSAMYSRNLVIFMAVAVFLFLIFLIGSIAQSRQRFTEVGGVGQFIGGNANIQRLIVSTETGDITLSQQSGIWTVQGAGGPLRRARPARVETFLNDLITAEFTRRVSRNLADAESFGLLDADTVALFDGENRLISRLHFGDFAGQHSEQYFSLEEEAEVYAIDTSLSFYLNQSQLYWTDLRLWEASEAEPLAFYRLYPDGRRENWLKDGDDNWVAEGGGEAAAGVVTAAGSLLRLEAQDVVDALPDESRYLYTLGIETSDSRIFSIMIYALETETVEYYMSQSEDGALKSPDGRLRFYILPEWQYETFASF